MQKRQKYITISITALSIVIAILGVVFYLSSSKSSYESKTSFTTSEALELSEAGKVIIVDIRPDNRCLNTGKAKGAVRMTFEGSPSEQTYINSIEDKFTADKTIALMCNTGRTATYLSNIAKEMGIKNIIPVAGGMEGIDGWVSHNFPVENCN